MPPFFVATPWFSLWYVVFSQRADDFHCERVGSCHGNHSIAIKILIVATRWGIRNKKTCVACRVSYCKVVWIGCYCWRYHNQNEVLLLLFSIVAIDSFIWQHKTYLWKWSIDIATQIRLLNGSWLLRPKLEAWQLGIRYCNTNVNHYN